VTENALDDLHMAHALGLAARGLGRTWPNPAVGCVIVRQGRILGRGWTQPGGRPHAERRALDQAGDASGATVYVTLEPCAHHGKTPPCADALIGAGVARVVTALTDPDPRVSGNGHAALRAAGITVTENVLAEPARHLTAGFLKRMTTGLPLVTLKLATTLDGRIATATGESRWITGSLARRYVHSLRLTHDAVMVGSGTARADDPDLTARDIGASHQPLRIVLDRTLGLPPTSRLGQTAQVHPVWVVHGPDAPLADQAAWTATGAELLACPVRGGRLDLTAALRLLAAKGLTRILCEGGGTLASALIGEGMVDEMILLTAGKVIGAEGTAALGLLGLRRLADAPGFDLIDHSPLGPDLLSHWVRRPG
jgi:diaminohydroxyphosphoribosylaminopyrimidine deaminase/5-amino-6-(5-phosphoribosylamino)uracil reductase